MQGKLQKVCAGKSCLKDLRLLRLEKSDKISLYLFLLIFLLSNKSSLSECSTFKNTIPWKITLKLSWCRSKFSESIPDSSVVHVHLHVQYFTYPSTDQAKSLHMLLPCRRLRVGTVVFLQRVITKTLQIVNCRSCLYKKLHWLK